MIYQDETQGDIRNMMYTCLDLAKQLNVSKQKIYRYIKKNHLNALIQEDNTIKFDESIKNDVVEHFCKSNKMPQNTSHDDMLIQQLQQQIEDLKHQIKIKDEQIQTNQELLKNQQVLMLQNSKKIELLETKEESNYKKTIFNLYKKIK